MAPLCARLAPFVSWSSLRVRPASARIVVGGMYTRPSLEWPQTEEHSECLTEALVVRSPEESFISF